MSCGEVIWPIPWTCKTIVPMSTSRITDGTAEYAATLSNLPNFASLPISDTNTHSKNPPINNAMAIPTGIKTPPIHRNLDGSGPPAGRAANCAAMAALRNGMFTKNKTTCTTDIARYGARKFGRSRTRSNTCVGSYSTLTTSSSALPPPLCCTGAC